MDNCTAYLIVGRRASGRFRTGFVILPPASCSRHNATHSFDAKCHPFFTVLNFITATFAVRAPPTLFSPSLRRRLQPPPNSNAPGYSDSSALPTLSDSKKVQNDVTLDSASDTSDLPVFVPCNLLPFALNSSWLYFSGPDARLGPDHYGRLLVYEMDHPFRGTTSQKARDRARPQSIVLNPT